MMTMTRRQWLRSAQVHADACSLANVQATARLQVAKLAAPACCDSNQTHFCSLQA